MPTVDFATGKTAAPQTAGHGSGAAGGAVTGVLGTGGATGALVGGFDPLGIGKTLTQESQVVLDFLTRPDTWIRVLKLVVGVTAILAGLYLAAAPTLETGVGRAVGTAVKGAL